MKVLRVRAVHTSWSWGDGDESHVIAGDWTEVTASGAYEAAIAAGVDAGALEVEGEIPAAFAKHVETQEASEKRQDALKQGRDQDAIDAEDAYHAERDAAGRAELGIG